MGKLLILLTVITNRQRYLDLMANPEVRRTFRTRSAVISALRRFLDDGLPREIVHFDPPLDAEGVVAGIDAYDKDLSDLDGIVTRTIDGNVERHEITRGWARGVELFLQRASASSNWSASDERRAILRRRGWTPPRHHLP